MDIIPSSLDAGETYASAADLLTIDDRPQATITVARWKRKLLVRPLSLEQQEQINRDSRRKDALSGQIMSNRVLFVAHTLSAACVQPQLDLAQAKALASKNATVLESIVDFIWAELSRLDHDTLAALVRSLANLESEDADAGDPDSTDDESVA